MENNLVGSHELKLSDRKNLSLSGIKKIISFNHEEFLMESNLGMLEIKGIGLELNKMDTNNGNVNIRGEVTTINYLNDNKKIKDESILSKLFK